MDRCRKCRKPLILGPSTCTHCGEPLFGMETVGAFNATPTTVTTFNSGTARQHEAPTQQPAYRAPVYTAATGSGSHDASRDGSRGARSRARATARAERAGSDGRRGRRFPVRLLFVVLFGGYVILRTLSGGEFHVGDTFDGSGSGGGSRSVVVPTTVELLTVGTLQPASRLEPNSIAADGRLASVTVIRNGATTSVGFMNGGTGDQPTRSLALSAGEDGSGPTFIATGGSQRGDPAIFGNLPPAGSLRLNPAGDTFNWTFVRFHGRRVTVVTISRGGAASTFHAGNVERASFAESGRSPLSYGELGTVIESLARQNAAAA